MIDFIVLTPHPGVSSHCQYKPAIWCQPLREQAQSVPVVLDVFQNIEQCNGLEASFCDRLWQGLQRPAVHLLLRVPLCSRCKIWVRLQTNHSHIGWVHTTNVPPGPDPDLENGRTVSERHRLEQLSEHDGAPPKPPVVILKLGVPAAEVLVHVRPVASVLGWPWRSVLRPGWDTAPLTPPVPLQLSSTQVHNSLRPTLRRAKPRGTLPDTMVAESQPNPAGLKLLSPGGVSPVSPMP